MTLFHRLVVCVVILHGLDLPARAADPKPSIKELVAKLRSPNAPPLKVKGMEQRYVESKSFSWAAQGQVHQAWDKLSEAGPEAIPALIEHFDNAAYSTTIASPLSDYWHNKSVGWVAREIVASQVRPFGQWQVGEGDPRDREARPDYARAHFGDKRAAEKWWKSREKLSLRELQLEAVEWTIAEEAKSPDEYSYEERAHLESLRKKLERESLPPGNPSSIYRMSRDTKPR